MVILRTIRWPSRDNLLRRNFVRFEVRKLVLRSFLSASYYPLFKRYYFAKSFSKITRKACIGRYRSSCMCSGNSRVVFRRFKLSRHIAKPLAAYGNMPGLRKSSF